MTSKEHGHMVGVSYFQCSSVFILGPRMSTIQCHTTMTRSNSETFEGDYLCCISLTSLEHRKLKRHVLNLFNNFHNDTKSTRKSINVIKLYITDSLSLDYDICGNIGITIPSDVQVQNQSCLTVALLFGNKLFTDDMISSFHCTMELKKKQVCFTQLVDEQRTFRSALKAKYSPRFQEYADLYSDIRPKYVDEFRNYLYDGIFDKCTFILDSCLIPNLNATMSFGTMKKTLEPLKTCGLKRQISFVN